MGIGLVFQNPLLNAVFNLSDRVQNAYNSTINKATEIYNKAIEYKETAAKLSGGEIGKQVAVLGGSFVGAALPGTSLGTLAGQTLANQLIPEQDVELSLNPETIQGIKTGLKFAGGAAGLVADLFMMPAGPVISLASTVAGTIAGEQVAGANHTLEDLDITSSESYGARLLKQGMAAGAANTLVGSIPVIGPLASIVAGKYAYNPELITSVGKGLLTIAQVTTNYVVNKLNGKSEILPQTEINIFNPGQAIQMAANITGGSAQVAVSELIQSQNLPIPQFAETLLGNIAAGVVDKQMFIPCAISALNEYQELIENPQISQQIDEFCKLPADRKSLKNLYDGIFNAEHKKGVIKAYIEKKLLNYLYSKLDFIDGLCDNIIGEIHKAEEIYIGLPIHHKDQDMEKFKVHLKIALLLVLKRTQQGITNGSIPELKDNDLEKFYLGFSNLILSHYPVPSFLKNALNSTISYLIIKGNFLANLTMSIANSIQGKGAKIEEIEDDEIFYDAIDPDKDVFEDALDHFTFKKSRFQRFRSGLSRMSHKIGLSPKKGFMKLIKKLFHR